MIKGQGDEEALEALAADACAPGRRFELRQACALFAAELRLDIAILVQLYDFIG
jgi:hypothetical protein